jgi:predicted ferric reductase
MRILNRTHLPWFLFVVLATIAAAWVYVGNFYPAQLPPGLALPPALVQKISEHRSIGGTPVGLVFGALAFAIFVFGALLSLRKKVVLWPIGSVQSWLRAHIWLTLLTIPLVLLHSGFRLGAPMTTLLMALYAVVMVSGIYGLFLQQKVPRIMQERLPTETIYEQIPYIRSQLARAAESMCHSLQPAAPHKTLAGAPAVDPQSEAALVAFLQDQVIPYLRARRGGRFQLGDSTYCDDTFRFVQLSVTEAYRSRVVEIQAWCDQRRLLDLQLRFHRWLHGWLFVHVPFSFLLLMLTAWHALVTLFYY